MNADLVTEYSYSKMFERLQEAHNKNNDVENLLAESFQNVKISQQSNLLLSSHHSTTSESTVPETTNKPEHNHISLSEEQNQLQQQKLQLMALNEKVINLQNLTLIYQDQYVARRNAKHIPMYFTQIVEARFHNHVRRSFEIWLSTLRYQQIINMMAYSREKMIKWKIFQALQTNVWTCKQFKNLQIKNKILVPRRHVFNAWVKYTQWCRRFNSLFHRSLYKIKRNGFDAFIELKDKIFDTRNFRINVKKIMMRETLYSLKRNVMLNKFLLRTAMKHQTKLLFFESYMRQYCLSKWKAATKFHGRMYNFEDIIVKLKVHKAFRHWKKYTQETAPTVTGLLAEIGKNAVLEAVSKFKKQPRRIESLTPTRQYTLQGDLASPNVGQPFFPPIVPAKSSVADIAGILVKSGQRQSMGSPPDDKDDTAPLKEEHKSNVRVNNKPSTISIETS